MPDLEAQPTPSRPIRWWPGVMILLLAVASIVWIRCQSEWPFQRRNLETAKVCVITIGLLLIWWTFFSRAPGRLRLSVTFGAIGLAALGAALFRIEGVSGDLRPLVRFRWGGVKPTVQPSTAAAADRSESAADQSFPQYYGPKRDGVLAGPALATKWNAQPPQLLWRQSVGPARSGFAVVGGLALTQEQQGDEECVVAYELTSGKAVWRHADAAHYDTVIAGNGPHATPTILSNRVFTLGGTGILNCLDLTGGKVLWTTNVVTASGGKVLEWGGCSSPLVAGDLVVVHGGGSAARSLYAFRLADGQFAWSAAAASPSYASPSLVTLAGQPQILAFNHRLITSHEPATGRQLWDRPWGNGNVVCSLPVIVSSNRVLFSSGYGFGAELLEISATDGDKFAAKLVWKSNRMKAKFAHLFARDGFLYGLDDGVLACVDLNDGSQRWKEGRYGHGQGLLIGNTYLLMAESGELVLLQPTPSAPHELARYRVFDFKTWNPIALAGDRLLVRNEREAACLRLKLADQR